MSTFTSRDQRILKLGLPVIALLLAVLLIKQIFAAHHTARQNLNRAAEDLVWLQRQLTLPSQVAGDCGVGLKTPDDLQQLATAKQLNVHLSASSAADEWVLNVNRASGNNILQLMRTLSCSGWQLQHARLLSGGDQGLVSGPIVVRR